MTERRQPVNAIRVSMICETCGVGEMRCVGGNPPAIYLHACAHCDAVCYLESKYPRIDYELIE